jgi:aminopeptidase-like protein
MVGWVERGVAKERFNSSKPCSVCACLETRQEPPETTRLCKTSMTNAKLAGSALSACLAHVRCAEIRRYRWRGSYVLMQKTAGPMSKLNMV